MSLTRSAIPRRARDQDPDQDQDPGQSEQLVVTPQKKFAYPPNLVVVDGGAPQVAAAAAALADLGIDDVSVCGLAKRLEEVWLPGQDYPVIMSRSSEGLYLLQRVRDEAHRFAITYHRAKRGKGRDHLGARLRSRTRPGQARRAAQGVRVGEGRVGGDARPDRGGRAWNRAEAGRDRRGGPAQPGTAEHISDKRGTRQGTGNGGSDQ